MRKHYLTRKFTGARSKMKNFGFAIIYVSIFVFINQNLKAQTAVTAINTNAVPATSSSYIEGGSTYNWGLGTDLFLTSVVTGGNTFTYDTNFGPTINLIRIDNGFSTGFRTRLFSDRVTNLNSNATYPAANADGSRMETALLEPILNRGALDVFHNVFDPGQNPNNIERVDVLYTPFTAPSTPALLSEIGYLVSEKSGNNILKVAAITSVDGSGNPASYGPLLTIIAANYGTPNAPILFTFYENQIVPPHTEQQFYSNSSERIGISVITFADLGIGISDTVYGISVFGQDVTGLAGQDLVDPSTFPTNSASGADVHGGLGAIVKTASVTFPEIGILGNAIAIPGDGSNTPNVADGTEFGRFTSGTSSTEQFFTIENTGTSDLIIGLSSIIGTDFTITTAPSSPVSPGGSTTIGITFNASVTGVINAQLSIPNNDPDENPTLINLQATTIGLPFDCDSSFFIVKQIGPGSQLFRIDRSTDPFTFVPFGPDTTVSDGYPNDFMYENLAYNPIDNYMYATVTSGAGPAFSIDDMVIIDRDGFVTNIGAISGAVPSNYAATFLKDGTYILGGGTDLTSIDITGAVPVVTNTVTVAGGVNFEDIAVNPHDPIVDRVYFADMAGINRVRWASTSVSGPPSGSATNPTGININSGSQLFDSFGNLYFRTTSAGFGVYKIDMDVTSPTYGVATFLSAGPTESFHDAASCTNSVAIEKTVNPTTVVAGNTVTYTYRISNPSDVAVAGLNFTDDLGDGRTFVDTSLSGALSGAPNAYGDTNLLTITGFTAPNNSISILTVDVNIPIYFNGTMLNQAQIDGLPANLGTSINSDDPDSVIYPDATPLIVTPGDTDGDGVFDIVDLDVDNDGIPNSDEYGGLDPYIDGDGDGIPIYADNDDGNPAIGDTDAMVEPAYDNDGDGVANHIDLDSDNDGISDIIEAGGIDVDGDAHVDYGTSGDPTTLNDGNFNGLDDTIEGVPLANPNTDGDLVADFLDIDADGDGIVDNIEGQTTLGYIAPALTDTDGDGLNDAYDADDETVVGIGGGTGVALVPTNTDGIDNPDYLDLDSDNDIFPDALEGWDTDNDNIADTVPTLADIDSDGLDDGYDADTTQSNPTNGQVPTDFPDLDNPGDDRDWRQGLDTDGDGIADVTDLDSDNDGILDLDESGGNDPYADLDGDGIPAYLDDDDTDNTVGDTNGTEALFDADGDGVANHLDLDSDNDGIADVVEAGGTDADGNGIIDGFTDVAPVDGLDDGGALPNPDTDGDGVPNFLDLDSDNDGLADVSEAGGTDVDGDGVIDGFTDSDGNGLDDTLDGSPLPTPNTDGDTLPDYLDLDSDNDGLADIIEAGGVDTNGDGQIDYPIVGDPTSMNDVDGDGFADIVDTDDNTVLGAGDGGTALPVPNSDSDTIPNYLDLDSDNDGITDVTEAGGLDADGNGFIDGFTDAGPINGWDDTTETTNLSNPDTDGDGVPNYLDLDSDNDGITDAREAGRPDVDGDGEIDGFDDTGNNNGLDDAIEATFIPITNTDFTFTSDLLPDYIDLDSDADGISDIIEAGGIDGDGDAHVDYITSGDPTTMTDVNSNGLLDTLEGAGLPVPNTDGTGGEDYIDIDADGDGIVDNIEGQTTAGYISPSGNDIDGDGLDDNYDGDDANTIGVIDPLGPSGALVPTNTDGAADEPDYLDLDSDDDGDLDSIEGWDTNNDGTPDTVPVLADADGDGLDNAYDVNDGLSDPTNSGQLPTDFPNLDVTPLDTDQDWREALDIDNDNDGIDDPADLDDDNDGIPDTDESGGLNPDADVDGDGIPLFLDDNDNDNTIGDTNGIEPGFDTDNDGVPNHLDLDSDNDGIYDIVESGQLNGTTIIDADNNGILDGAPILFGTNGLLDALEDAPDSGTLSVATADSDTDGIPDSNELNSDNDGCSDVLEAGFTDTDGSGRLGADAGLTVDANGIVNTPGLTDGYTTPLDGDGNSIFDFQEVGQAVSLTTQPVSQTIIINSDANFDVTGTSPVYQWQESTDSGATWNNITDGGAIPTYSGATTASLMLTTVPLTYDGYQYRVILSSPAYACDGNITSDAAVLNFFSDNDGDGIPDFADLDDDNDGIPDTDESGGLNPDADVDGDGIPAYLDDNDNDNAIGDTNGIEPGFDTDNDGVANHLDLDSDNDGIFDIVESGQLNGTTILDADNNGILDGAPILFGTNGLLDALEDAPDSGTLSVLTADSDGDLIPDSNELNSDNDGCSDVLEAGFTDSDGSGRLGSDTGLTVDANGVVNTPGLTDGYTTPLDGDSNGIFDFQEVGMAVNLNLQQPADQTITINSNANFDVTGSTAPVYQWQENDGTGWTNVIDGGANPAYSGATTDALTLTLVPGSYDGYQYRVILSSPAYACDGNITSNSALLTVFPDFDGDGVGDPVDLDDDNDGIPDLVELNGLDPLADDDGDGVPNYLDDQPGNAAVGDANGLVEPAYDFDGDNIPNHLDIDSDNDGINDVIEAGHGFPDTDGDGFIDGADTGSGANGLFDGVETDPDVDPTLNYPITDTDNDGNSNFLDIDDDNDGIDTIVETPNGDTDGDGVDNHLDIDDDNDGILTATEGTANSDSDSFPNYLDQDSDGDGIADNVEGQTTAGYLLPAGTDSDNDGLDDAYDNFDNLTVNDPNNNIASQNGIQPVDTDSGIFGADGFPDYIDQDSDGDNVPDSIEGNDLDENGVADNFPSGDSDNDGIDDSFDGDTSGFGDPNGSLVTTNPAIDLPDTDGTEDVNYRDIDDDGDGIHTRYEDLNSDNDFANDDTDTNGTPNYLDNDDDGDGVLTIDENPDPNGDGNPADAQDLDADGIPDYLDDDDDNDGIPTADEGTGDTDGDGRPDYLDIDDDGDGIMTINETISDEDGDSHPNYLDLDSDDDGIPDNVEGQTTAGYILPAGIDSDNDGLDDAYDTFDNNANNVLANYEEGNGIQPVNTDGTDDEDYLDTDSDNDNVPDFVEGHDFDADGNPDIEASGNDTDGDGLDDAYDSSSDFSDPNGLTITTGPAADLPNRDQSLFDMLSPTTAITPDAEVDYRDTDDDGDGRLTNSTGADGEDTDSDGDPRNDNCNGPPDNNSPNYLDPVPCNFIPSGFSPNGDNQNEEFIINQLSEFPNFTMEVYDRWGNIVYEYSNNGRAEPLWWDGFSTGSRTLDKGQKVPVGTYYYVIEYNQDGRRPVSGWVYINY